MTLVHRLLSSAMLLAGLLVFHPAHAAESYDSCSNHYIDSLPATIATQGTWCLRKDLSTNITSGAAITIATNNVTIDCNGYKVGGLAAGPGTGATGIDGGSVLNATVRNCNVRGFFFGLYFNTAGAGITVEHNRVEQSIDAGLWVDGESSVIRDNQVSDVAGASGGDVAGILAQGDNTLIENNRVAGVLGTPDAEGSASGIHFNGDGSVARGNFISGVVKGGGSAAGISNNKGAHNVIEQNILVEPSYAGSAATGIDVWGGGITASAPVCLNNRVRGFTVSAYGDCLNGGGNYSSN